MPQKISARDTYRWTLRFEEQIIKHCIENNHFWARLNEFIDHDRFKSELVQIVFRAVKELRGENIKSCSYVLVLERIMRWHRDGAVTSDTLFEIDDYLCSIEIKPAEDPEFIINEAKPHLKEIHYKEAVMDAIKGVHNKTTKTIDVANKMRRIDTIGDDIHDVGLSLGVDLFEEIKEERNLAKTPIGVPDLDRELGGGANVKTLTLFLAESGGCKSMSLAHVAGTSVLQGINVAVASLEIPRTLWGGRLTANITGVPIDDVMSGTHDDEVRRIMSNLKDMGRVAINYFSPDTTTVDDLIIWLDNIEDKQGWKPEVIIVDYLDLLGYKVDGTYAGMKEVCIGLRDRISIPRDAWVFSGTQSTRKSSGKQKTSLGIDKGADSQNKIRVCDLWIYLQLSDDGSELTYTVGKNRYGKRGASIQLPTELECARLVPLSNAR